MRPLDGTLVLDLSRVLAGPYATMYLADMGARVIKVERPGKGDDTRGYGPPFLEGESCYFMSINRGKESVTIDLKDPDGLALVQALARRADVLVENFRPGTAERLGLGYEALSAHNEGLVYVSVSGFGHEGDPEYTARPGYDLLAQGLSGLQSITGSPDGQPFRVGVAVGDLVAGIYAVTGTLAALLVRRQTGRGQRVDVSLLDGLTSLLSYQAGIALNGGGQVPKRMGNAHPSICPYDTFEASDGFVNIAAGNDTHFRNLVIALGEPALADDARFVGNTERVRNRDELSALLIPLIRQRTVAECSDLLLQAGIPGGPILDVPETLSHPQVLARNMVVSLAHPETGQVRVTGFPFGLSQTPCAPTVAPPRLGEHTDSVLQSLLGVSEERLNELRERGIL